MRTQFGYVILNRLLAFQGFDEWGDGTIERVGDGAEQFSLAGKDLAIGGDGLGASEQHISFHVGSGLGEPVEGRMFSTTGLPVSA